MQYPEDVRMTVGKFKRKRLVDIPSGYLHWIAENFDDDYIATAADVMWRFREKHSDHWEE